MRMAGVFEQPTPAHTCRRISPKSVYVNRPFPRRRLRFLERLGIDLIQELELYQRRLDELFAIALCLDLSSLLDPTEILVIGEDQLLRELLAHKPGDFGDDLDRQ